MDYGLRITFFALCLCTSVVKSDTHYVSKKGSNIYPYTTIETAANVIQDAVFAATDGDTILVNDGVYKTGGAVAPGETLTSRVMVTNSIILKSVNGAKKTKVIGKINNTESSDRSDDIRGFYFGTNAQITGFTIKKGGAINGGGIYANNKTIINNCIILKCFSDEIGGGTYFNTFGIVSNCVYKGNYAYYQKGGAIYCNTNLIMTNCEIIGNVGETIISCNGGIISDSTFSKNKIGYEGITLYNGIITNCHITKNHAEPGQGIRGILVCTNSIVVNCLFDKNKDVVLNAENSIIKNCKFYKNKNIKEIRRGGCTGMVFINESSILTNCTFTRNCYGAGIDCANFSTAVNCNISHNVIKSGLSFLDLWQSTAINCNIINNKNKVITSENANIYGNAVHASGSEMYNCLVANNSGYSHNPDFKDVENNFGGGIACNNSTKIYNCTIVANKIKRGNGGGIYFNYDLYGEPDNSGTNLVYNTIIVFNKAKINPQVGGRNYKLINCYMGETPDFIDYKTGDYHLKPTSPCINAGTNMDWMVGATDLDGNPMPTNEPINLGAFQE